MKGYLLIVNSEKVFVYNVLFSYYVRVGVFRFVFFLSIDEFRLLFLNNNLILSLDGEIRVIFLIVSDREKFVIVGFGGGYVGMYYFNLFIFKGEFNIMLWISFVLFFIFFLFGVWYFFVKKKEVFILWGLDDLFSFTLVIISASLVFVFGDRFFVDFFLRSFEVMDFRGGNFRVLSRRYGFFLRYFGGGVVIFYRFGVGGVFVDYNVRLVLVDLDFRVVFEFKFRVFIMDFSGFFKRRDGMFVGN